MVTSLTETSDQTNKSFYTNVVFLLFITKLYLKNFKQFCLCELMKKVFFLFINLQSEFTNAFNFSFSVNSAHF